ncbi:hypothetical protein PR048_001971 [Dryococelus australis]|uniref:DDE-1 domain-containing protein n=1 Tax=Dryococelus australis TaxID=614101 RepID=A0ABQ9IIU8_9NEOP|nr:hypothetical protein PR048_001971 [Dryococelus australis]
MTSVIFLDWFKNEFIPSVTKFHKEKKKKVQFLPPNITATLQQMDQGVIEKIKRIYRKQLLHHHFWQKRTKRA